MANCKSCGTYICSCSSVLFCKKCKSSSKITISKDTGNACLDTAALTQTAKALKLSTQGNCTVYYYIDGYTKPVLSSQSISTAKLFTGKYKVVATNDDKTKTFELTIK